VADVPSGLSLTSPKETKILTILTPSLALYPYTRRKYSSIMAPKVTRGEKPTRRNVISTIEMKKELITKWEGGIGLSDLAAQYPSYYYYYY
jgi:hypothetical protein